MVLMREVKMCCTLNYKLKTENIINWNNQLANKLYF